MTATPRWNTAQDQLLSRLAGTMPVSELTRKLSEVGPTRTVSGVTCHAAQRGIVLRPESRRLSTREPGTGRSEWTLPEDQVLSSGAGELTAVEIAERLNQRFLTQRKAASVRNRARCLRVSLLLTGLLSQIDLTSIFPVHNRRFERWHASGALLAHRRGTGKHGSRWWYRPSDVEAFIRAHPHLFDWRRVKAGRWRELVRSVALHDPWLSVAEVAAVAGVRPATLHVWLATGLVDGARRVGEHPGSAWRIPSSALVGIDRLAGRLLARSEVTHAS